MTSYADNAWYGPVTVAENVQVARDTYRLRFACPEIAKRVVPGQFLMLRLADRNDPLLGRPLALYDIAGDCPNFRQLGDCPSFRPSENGTVPLNPPRPHFVDVVYLVVGKATRLLAEFKPGERLDVWGPLGNGFPPTPAEHLVMVAGGIGQTPLLSLAREHLGLHAYGDPPRHVPQAKRVTLCYGAQSRDYLACVDDFRRAGVDVKLSTDDGSEGHQGFVTHLITPTVEQSPWPCRIVCCGPEAMMAATTKIAGELGIPCEVSLESPMACGVGVCYSCVQKIRDAQGGWDYRRTCVEGPVFNGANVEF
jgi:dihydroorotate dehydrogenase electron transfer subunit